MSPDRTADRSFRQQPYPIEYINQLSLKYKSIKPEDQIASEAVNPKEIKPDSQPTNPPDSTVEREVNLCCKVPESWRRHWAAESKRNGVTMTEVITEAFTAKFGLPEDRHK